jgi:hypothetical protein
MIKINTYEMVTNLHKLNHLCGVMIISNLPQPNSVGTCIR